MPLGDFFSGNSLNRNEVSEGVTKMGYQEKLHLLTAFSSGLLPEGIPDPYYGNTTGFEHVHELLGTALDGFLESLLLPALLEQEQENLS